jgi:hypothetical protein
MRWEEETNSGRLICKMPDSPKSYILLILRFLAKNLWIKNLKFTKKPSSWDANGPLSIWKGTFFHRIKSIKVKIIPRPQFIVRIKRFSK